jgi:hypothetical protein
MSVLWDLALRRLLPDAALHVQPVLVACLSTAPWRRWRPSLAAIQEACILPCSTMGICR